MNDLVSQITKLNLYQDPELRARQLYEFLREQKPDVREYLQSYIDDMPLTKELSNKFLTESGDSD